MTRYCEMCDEWMRPKECPKCGAETVRAARTPQSPPPVVDLMDALRRALPSAASRDAQPPVRQQDTKAEEDFTRTGETTS